MGGCLAFGAMILLATISMGASFVVFFDAVITGNAIEYVIAAVLMVVGILMIVVTRKKFRAKSEAKEMEFLRNHPTVGLLRITHRVNGKSKLDYNIIEGPIKSTDELYIASDTAVSYLTYYFVAGTYTIDVKYVEETVTSTGGLHRNEASVQRITFTVESEKYHELHYDKNTGVYEFEQKNPPKSLKPAYALMSKAIKKEIKMD